MPTAARQARAMITVPPANTTAPPEVALARAALSCGCEASGEERPVAGDDEQGVVDAHGEADHDGQGRSGLGQVDHARERGQARHADAHAERGGQQRHAGGEQRRERDRQHQERDHHAHRLGAVVGLLGGDAAGELDLQAGLLAGRAEVGELLAWPRSEISPEGTG